MNAELLVARGCCLIPTLNPSRVDLNLNAHTSQPFRHLIGPTTPNAIAIRRDVLVVEQFADLDVLSKHARDHDHCMNATIPLPASVFNFERS